MNRLFKSKNYFFEKNSMDLPKISIVTPSFNQGQYLEQTILSIIGQGYPNLEYIIIDGGSTDNSLEIIKKYEKHLAYWVSQPDTGHANALNKGFSKASGEIMAWLNSDDMYCPGAFSAVAEIFNSFEDVNWIIGHRSYWDESGRQILATPAYKNIYDFLAGNYRWLQQESIFWRRRLWEKAGSKINEQYKFQVDAELWCRFFLRDELWHVARVLGGYRNHSANRSKIHRSDTIKEIEMAISELKNNCSSKVKRKAKISKYLKRIRKLFRLIKMDRFYQAFFIKFFKDLSYKKLIFKDGKWVKAILK